MDYKVKEGDYARMGAVQNGGEVIFTFAGEKEDQCCIVLIDKKTGQEERIHVPDAYCLGSLRSVSVSGIRPELCRYYYEINGEERPDPYAHAVEGREKWNDLSRKENGYRVYGSFRRTPFDWEEDAPPEIPKEQIVMYKLHVRGFTMDHGAPKRIAGTFAALTEKAAYLKSLGITTVELMPVYEFEEIILPKPVEKVAMPDYIRWEAAEEDLIQPKEVVSIDTTPAKALAGKEEESGSEEPQPEKPKLNYWGYVNDDSNSYFAVKASYAKDPARADAEFKQLVKCLHDNGIECVVEMYFPESVNHNLIVDALRYWVWEYHVDGFHLIGDRLPVTAVVQDVMLSRTKIFYTYFDQAVLNDDRKYRHLFIYQEEYLYSARKLLNHINGDMREFLNQQKKQGTALGYVNFLSSNNGFTLADVFMYNDKHNEANGEDNADGNTWNFSSNYGVEGSTRKKYIAAIRKRQWRNAMLMLFLAQGVPLVWAGDEMCNSQNGNNNAYCQDNPVGWLNWKNEKTHEKEIDFVRRLIRFRREYPLVANADPFRFYDYRSAGFPDVSYHGENAWISEFDLGRMSLGILYCGAYSKDKAHSEDIYTAFNFYSAVSTVALPKLSRKKKWYLLIDSANEEEPILDQGQLCSDQQFLLMKPQSICVLIGK